LASANAGNPTGPNVPIVFCEIHQLAPDWTCRILEAVAACAEEEQLEF
jgi:hypothetical protein